MSEAVQEQDTWALWHSVQQTTAAFDEALELYRREVEFTQLAPALMRARAALARARDDVDELTEMAVQRAARRETWDTIGRSLGVSRQAAAKKYGAVRA